MTTTGQLRPPSAPARTRSPLGRLVVVLFMFLPLQWFGLGSTPLGSTRLHQVALAVFAAVVVVRFRARAQAPTIRAAAPFVIATLYMAVAWAAVDLYNGRLPTGSVQELVYLVVMVALGTCFYRAAAAGKEPGMAATLRWVAPAAVVSVVVGFSVAMVVNGVNPAAVMARTVASADPEIFQKEVFKSSFAGFGLDEEMVRGNLRHEIFGSLLLAAMISTWAMRFGPVATRAQRIAHRTALATTVALLALSMSRSVLIAAAVWPLLALSRSLHHGGLTRRQLTALSLAVLGTVGLAVSGVATVIWNRFTTDTTGYGTRASNYGDAFDALPDVWLTGGYETGGVSSHNFVFDSLLRGGIFTALPALVMLLVLLFGFVRLAARLPSLPEWMVPVTAALALPLVRMGTSGGGLIPPVEWAALAFFFGVLAHVQRTRAAPAPAARPSGPGRTETPRT